MHGTIFSGLSSAELLLENIYIRSCLFSCFRSGNWVGGGYATVGVGKLGKRNEIGMVMVWRLEGMLEQSLVKITTATEFKN